MAKVKLDPIDPKSHPNLRGKFYVRDTRHGAVAQAWPKKRGKARSGYDLYRQTEFGLAARWASQPEPIGYQTAIFMARGTEYVPRDLLMKASMGVLFDEIIADGITFTPSRLVNPNAQLILDQICDDEGAILYRSSIGWVCLPIGNEGDLMQVVDGLPAWVGEPVPPPETWLTVWITSLGNNANNRQNTTERVRWEAGRFSSEGSKCRLRFQASATQQLSIGPCYFGQASTSPTNYGFAATPKQILFDGVATVTIAAGASIVSDAIDHPVSPLLPYVASWYHSGATSGIRWTSGLTGLQAAFKAGNDAATVSATGYTVAGGQCYAVDRVEAQIA